MMINFKYVSNNIRIQPHIPVMVFHSLQYDVVNNDRNYSLKTPLESFMTFLRIIIIMTRNDNALNKNLSPSATHTSQRRLTSARHDYVDASRNSIMRGQNI